VHPPLAPVQAQAQAQARVLVLVLVLEVVAPPSHLHRHPRLPTQQMSGSYPRSKTEAQGCGWQGVMSCARAARPDDAQTTGGGGTTRQPVG